MGRVIYTLTGDRKDDKSFNGVVKIDYTEAKRGEAVVHTTEDGRHTIPAEAIKEVYFS